MLSSIMEAFLISGRTGAGKSTLAKQLTNELSAFRISHDEWLAVLYGPQADLDKFRDSCERVNRLIWLQVASLSKIGVPVVIEGFGSRALRDAARVELQQLGIDYEFLYVDCPRELRWQRVQRRNENLNEEGFFISLEDFQRMEAIKEEFDPDEQVRIVDNSGHNKCVHCTR